MGRAKFGTTKEELVEATIRILKSLNESKMPSIGRGLIVSQRLQVSKSSASNLMKIARERMGA